MNKKEILNEIEKLNHIAFKLQKVNKNKALECLFKVEQLGLELKEVC